MSVPAAFDYHPATTVEEALTLLQQYGDEAKILAGGHSLIPALKLRLAQPEHVIDIGTIPGLSFIRAEEGLIVVGAMTSYTQITQSELLRRHFALLVDGAAEVGDQQVRNRGTIGGSIAHADPAADMPGIVLALKGQIVAQGPDGVRTIAADDFFQGPFTTALEPNELVTELRFALPPTGSGSAYIKLPNKASHYALTGCAAVLTRAEDGSCSSASIAMTGASLQATRASAVEAALLGKPLDASTITEAANHAADGLDLISDIHGSEAYRRQMTVVIARRALSRAVERM